MPIASLSGSPNANRRANTLPQNPHDPISYLCAWLALVPQALCVIYVTLIWSTREVEILLMFAGQMGCEALNFLLKRLIKEERPKRRFYFVQGDVKVPKIAIGQRLEDNKTDLPHRNER